MPAKTNSTPDLPAPIKVPSDDCTVTVDGVEYHLHRGQSVSVVGTRSIGEMKAAWGFNRLSAELDAVKGEPDENVRAIALLEEHYDSLLLWMADRIVDWDWTDQRGRLLPKPDGTTDPLLKLAPDELFYLTRILRGEGPADEKNSS